MKRSVLTTLVTIIFITLNGMTQTTHGFFRFFTAPAEPPEITEPADRSRFTTGDQPPAIRWTDVENTDEYELLLSLNSEFSAPFSLFMTEPFLDLADLMDQATWDDISLQLFFKVRALLIDDTLTEWSNPVEFAKSIAGAPTILSPVDNARFLPGMPMPVLEWSTNPDAGTYMIEFASDPSFMNSYGSFRIDSTVIDTNLTGDPDVWDLITGLFYWRVWGLEKGWVPTPPTNAYSFSKTVSDPTVLLTPEDNLHFAASSPPPVFSWEPLLHLPDEYHIQFVYADQPFPAGGAYIPTDSAAFTFASIGITDEIWESFYGKLSWRVAGLDENGYPGGFSQPFRFTKVSAKNYMAYGDSVTGGWGASDFNTGYAGFPRQLRTMLRDKYSDDIQVFCEHNRSWFSGGHAYTGSARIASAMEYHGPQHVLIMLGIVDIVDPGAPGCDNFDCHTIDHLSYIIDEVRDYKGIPYLAILPPVNPASSRAFLQYHVDALNNDIQALAQSKGVQTAPLDNAFFTAPRPLPDYFTYDDYIDEPDWAHFNDLGHMLIAETWLQLL